MLSHELCPFTAGQKAVLHKLYLKQELLNTTLGPNHALCTHTGVAREADTFLQTYNLMSSSGTTQVALYSSHGNVNFSHLLAKGPKASSSAL